MPTIKEAPYEKERQRIFEKERQRVIKRMKKAIEKEQFKISLLQTIKPGVIYNICLKTGCYLKGITYYVKVTINVVAEIVKIGGMQLTVNVLAAKSDDLFDVCGVPTPPDLQYYEFKDTDEIKNFQSFINMNRIISIDVFVKEDLPLLMGWPITNPLMYERLKKA